MEYIFLKNSVDAYLVCFEAGSKSAIPMEKLKSILSEDDDDQDLEIGIPAVFVGSKLARYSAWGSNAKKILSNCGIHIERIEKFRIQTPGDEDVTIIDPLLEQIYYADTFDIETKTKTLQSDIVKTIPVADISNYNSKMNLGFDDQDLEFYTNLYLGIGKSPTNLELLDLSQSNSEHSRHHFFKGKIVIDGISLPESLFNKVKETNMCSETARNSVLAFCDNASAIRNSIGGDQSIFFFIDPNGNYATNKCEMFSTFTAETHNFPTLMEPFSGAATGVGGRIRDTLAIGRGGTMIAGTAGYCTKNQQVMVEASNGASDYGNKIGEPIILGFARIDKAWEKPIMFTGGFGQVLHTNVLKMKPRAGDVIVKVGGPAYRIGVGGGSASSRTTTRDTFVQDVAAVQRGDPEMENKLYKFMLRCIELGDANPIVSIHDQGAGGTANVTKEIVEGDGSGCGAQVFLDRITCGDKTLTSIEKWISEYQEQITIVVRPESTDLVSRLAAEENVTLDVFGTVDNSGTMKVYERQGCAPVFALPLEAITQCPQKTYRVTRQQQRTSPPPPSFVPESTRCVENITTIWKNVLSDPAVGSKRFLVSKVDRSVSGKVVQQQCVGKFHLPISDYSLVLHSLFSCNGIAGSIGERHFPIEAAKKMVAMSIGEMLTNLAGVKVSRFSDIKCQANWMWPDKSLSLVDAVYELSRILKILQIGIDGGKDSLSMRHNGVSAPGSLVFSSYAPVPNVTKHVTPEFKRDGNPLYFIDLGYGNTRLGGSVFAKHFGNDVPIAFPTFEHPKAFRGIFEFVQQAVETGTIVSIHDRSDGGLFATLAEMTMASGIGASLYLDQEPQVSPQDLIPFLFNEELGWIVEVAQEKQKQFERIFAAVDSGFFMLHVHNIGQVEEGGFLRIFLEHTEYSFRIQDLSATWEDPSRQMELLQTNNMCVSEEYDNIYSFGSFPPDDTFDHVALPRVTAQITEKVVGIFRSEGSNGEYEMAAAFRYAGFQTMDLTFDILLKSPRILDRLAGVAFVGGFTFMDVLGAGRGVSETIKHNPILLSAFQQFFKREDVFSLGICNGCQFMIQLNEALGIGLPKVQIKKNRSGRFESRYSYVRIASHCNSQWTCDLAGTSLGVWSAFSTGRFEFDETDPDNPIATRTDIMYYASEMYPQNPGSSQRGLAGVCSKNGRHLAMMPHPERTFLSSQIPWKTGNASVDDDVNLTAWSRLFSAFA